jgi:hypothetical protein
MKLCYFILDARAQLRGIRGGRVTALLDGRVSAAGLGSQGGCTLYLVTVACGAALLPLAVYLLRAPLAGGRLTAADELTLRALASSDWVTPHEAATHHGRGWPPGLVRQLAVALGVPVSGMAVPFAPGGPAVDAIVRRTGIGPGQS